MASPAARVLVDPSQFPAQVATELLECLRSRQVEAKFLYEGRGQVQSWLALHEAFSPARTDPDCQAIYDRSFRAATQHLTGSAVHLFGVSCGGAQKEARLLDLLNEAGKQTAFSPIDVSLPMVLTASATVSNRVTADRCRPCLMDLQHTRDARAPIQELQLPGHHPLFTFFGAIHNFEPTQILPKLSALLRSSEFMLLSANLAPAESYDESLRAILPGYDNQLTRDWLITFLRNLGAEVDGTIHFTIESNVVNNGLKRICAYYTFRNTCQLSIRGEIVDFKGGDSIRLFFSDRYTAPLLRTLMAQYGLVVVQEWIARSGEEGVFLARRTLT